MLTGAALQGAAHFLEHLMFLGSEAFPDEGNIDRYARLHNGDTNASSDMEATSFVADAMADGLPGMMERMVAALSAPLLRMSSMKREVQSYSTLHPASLMSVVLNMMNMMCFDLLQSGGSKLQYRALECY
jgi:insulysin